MKVVPHRAKEPWPERRDPRGVPQRKSPPLPTPPATPSSIRPPVKATPQNGEMELKRQALNAHLMGLPGTASYFNEMSETVPAIQYANAKTALAMAYKDLPLGKILCTTDIPADIAEEHEEAVVEALRYHLVIGSTALQHLSLQAKELEWLGKALEGVLHPKPLILENCTIDDTLFQSILSGIVTKCSFLLRLTGCSGVSFETTEALQELAAEHGQVVQILMD